MKKANLILRDILYRIYERDIHFMSQRSLAESCDLSSETVNRLVSKLHQFRAIRKKPQGFRVVDPRKVLHYWSAIRDLHEDIVWSAQLGSSMEELESELPEGSVLTAYSGYRMRFEDVPVPYNKVYTYASHEEVRRRFPKSKTEGGNLVVLEPDSHIEQVSEDGAAPLAQIYVDLWQIGTSGADRYRRKLEKELEPRPLEILKDLAGKGF